MAKGDLTRASLAKEIRALMDSTPDALNSRQIENDYRSLCGQSLRTNCKQLGFNDTDSFLLAISKDGAVVLQHSSDGGYIYRAGVADKSTSHIQDLVRKQAKKKGGRKDGGSGFRSGGSARSSSSTSRLPPPRKELPKAIQANIIRLLRERNHETPLCNLIKFYHDKYGSNLNYRTHGFQSLRESVSSIGEINVTTVKDSVMISCVPVAPLLSPSTVENVRQKLKDDIFKVLGGGEIPLTKFSNKYEQVLGRALSPIKYGYCSLLNLLNDLVDAVDLYREDDTGDWIVCKANSRPKSHQVSKSGDAPSNEIKKQKRLPYEMIKMIREVVKGNSHGIYVANFDQTFKLETDIDLNARTYGYETITSLLMDSLNEELEIVPAKFGDLIRVVPSEQSEPIVDPLVSKATSSDAMDLHDAVGPGVCYNRPSVPPLNRYIEVIVSQINNPSDFYIQVMATDNTGKRLEELMDQLEEFYLPLENSKSYLLPRMFAVPGQLVVCKFPNDQFWHRARISKVIDNNFVRVLFVDYGTSCAVHKSQLYYLRQQFLTLPVQAQPATLYGISPVTGQTWTSTANKAFLNLTTDKRLCAMVMDISKDQRLALCLADTTGTIDLHINDYLVSSEFAKFTDMDKALPAQHFNQVKESDIDWHISSDEEDEEYSGDGSDADQNPFTTNIPRSRHDSHTSDTHSSRPSASSSVTVFAGVNQSSHTLTEAAPAETMPVLVPADQLTTPPPDLVESPVESEMPPLEPEMPPLEPEMPPLEPEMPSLEPVVPTLEPVVPPLEPLLPPLESYLSSEEKLEQLSEVPLLEPEVVKKVIAAQGRTSHKTAKVKPQKSPVQRRVQHPNHQTRIGPSYQGIPPHYPAQQYYSHNPMQQVPPPMMAPPYHQPYVGQPAFPHYEGQPLVYQAQQYLGYQGPRYMVPTPVYYPQGPPYNQHTFGAQSPSHRPPPQRIQAWSGSQARQSQHLVGHRPPSSKPQNRGPPALELINEGPPPLEPVNGGPPPLEVNEDVPPSLESVTDEPPPLIPLEEVMSEASTSGMNNSEQRTGGKAGKMPIASNSAESLAYRLNGLQLKQKRLRRNMSTTQMADYSGAESSDSELADIDREIKECTQLLSGMLGVDGKSQSGNKIPFCGRGRGRLHLLALTADD